MLKKHAIVYAQSVLLLASLSFAASPSSSPPKILFEPKLTLSVPVHTPLEAAHQYLSLYLQSQNSKLSPQNFQVGQIKKSLLHTHFHFQQTLNAQKVDGAEIILSINEQDLSLFQTFDSTSSAQLSLQHKRDKVLSEDQAFDLVWHHLRVHGHLMEKPTLNKSLKLFDKMLREVYTVRIAVGKPFGYWEYAIDTHTGHIYQHKERSLPRLKRLSTTKSKDSYHGPIWSRTLEFARFYAEESNTNNLDETSRETDGPNYRDGKGLVFDPDPITSTGNTSLTINSPASFFESAYQQRVLRDLGFANGLYTLSGRWVKIIDFEPPNTPPTTTKDGNWSFKRGNNSFNDAMTYFHLDQSQRYIQSLGFTGEKGIQNIPLEVDSDGLNGEDNSHFIPETNRLAFGHGCVPDNEDAAVILHEYGHAIQFAMNSNWDGGDTGAMGEGFGDYWAASYIVNKTPTKELKTIFSWDASSGCWDGRHLDRIHAMYNPQTSYGAHDRMDGFVADELWSTPLFQALTELKKDGILQSKVDQVILEAHFGLGGNVLIPQMAQVLIHTAIKGFGDEVIGSVFHKHFAAQHILAPNPSIVLYPTPPIKFIAKIPTTHSES